MATAETMLLALTTAGLPVTGFTIRDVDDPDTWTFYGPDVTPEHATAAVAIIEQQLHPAPAQPQLSKLAFLRLLQPDEYAAFARGADTDAVLLYGKALLDAALTMTATEPSFLQMLQYCVGKGIFSPDRAAAIVKGMAPQG